jgi:hypothetical protein
MYGSPKSDPDLSKSFLPDYKGPNKKAEQQPQPASGPDLPQQFLPDFQGPRPGGANPYANVPQSQYANAPGMDPNKWVPGVIRNTGPQIAANAAPGAPAPNAPQVKARRPLPALPRTEPYTGDGVTRVVTEKLNPNGARGDKDRTVMNVPDKTTFEGRIVAKKPDGGLLLKSTAGASDRLSDTLVHLPASAATQFSQDHASSRAVDKSLENGRDGSPVAVSHNKGKWSVSDTAKRGLTGHT